jgi:hypothetical protein
LVARNTAAVTIRIERPLASATLLR